MFNHFVSFTWRKTIEVNAQNKMYYLHYSVLVDDELKCIIKIPSFVVAILNRFRKPEVTNGDA
jgi:hypothetical protein